MVVLRRTNVLAGDTVERRRDEVPDERADAIDRRADDRAHRIGPRATACFVDNTNRLAGQNNALSGGEGSLITRWESQVSLIVVRRLARRTPVLHRRPAACALDRRGRGDLSAVAAYTAAGLLGRACIEPSKVLFVRRPKHARDKKNKNKN